MKRIVVATVFAMLSLLALPEAARATTSGTFYATGTYCDQISGTCDSSQGFSLTVSTPNIVTVGPTGAILTVTLTFRGTNNSLLYRMSPTSFVGIDSPTYINATHIPSFSLVSGTTPDGSVQVWRGSVHITPAALHADGGFGHYEVGNFDVIMNYDNGTSYDGAAEFTSSRESASSVLVPGSRKWVAASHSGRRTTVTVHASRLAFRSNSTLAYVPWYVSAKAWTTSGSPFISRYVHTNTHGFASFIVAGDRLRWAVS